MKNYNLKDFESKDYESMSLYYDGELSGQELEVFEKRLQASDFAREYESFARVLVYAADIELVEPPAVLRGRIMKRVREEARPVELIGEKVEKTRKKRRSLQMPALNINIRALGGAAAVVVAAVFAVGALFNMFATPVTVTTTDAHFTGVELVAPAPAAAGFEVVDTPRAFVEFITDAVAEPEQREWFFEGFPDIIPQDRIIRSASISIEVEDIDSAVWFINTMSGGHNENVNIQYFEDAWFDGRSMWHMPRSSASVTRRVPLGLFNEQLADIRSLGRVVHESEDTRSVNTAMLNAHARSDALDTEIQRLLAYLEQADSVGDMTMISARIASVEHEILDTRGQIAGFENSINLPVVSISITEVVYGTTGHDPEGFWQEVRGGFDGSIELIGAVFTEVTVLVVWLALPALIMVALALVVRRVFRAIASREKPGKGESGDEA